jgi:glycosyltransferase involved in cell wall biosynthesis
VVGVVPGLIGRSFFKDDQRGRRSLLETLIVIPIFDEWPHVVAVLESLKSRFPNILVIEDGASGRALKDYANSNQIEYISVLFNLGAWSAIQIGFRYALLKGYQNVVTFDGDGQHLPEEIEKLIAQLRMGYDIIIGSCLERGGFLRKACRSVLRRLSGLEIYDITSGFRAYSRSAFQRLAQVDQANLEYQDLGVLLLAQRWGLKCSEIDIRMGERLAGRSKIFPGMRFMLQYLLTTLVSLAIKWR